MKLSAKMSQYLRELVARHAAIHLDKSKDYLLESRLLPLVLKNNYPSVEDLARDLSTQLPGTLHKEAVEALSTQETWFFRDCHPFSHLRQVLGHLLEKKDGPLRIWSAATSTGQEAYSIAMVVAEHFSSESHRIQIVASDFSEKALEKAQKGVYTQLEINRGLPARLLIKYFHQKKKNWEISETIKDLVDFQRVNLIGDWPFSQPFDIIFCRNVLIYFQDEIKKKIYRRLADQLTPQGYLYLGGAESPFGLSHHFRRLPTTRCYGYQKKVVQNSPQGSSLNSSL